MSGPEARNPAPAGISSPEETDVAALFDRLREELRRGAVHEDSQGADFASTRALAERFWPVTAERPAGGGPKGVVKRVLRKIMRWYVEPLAADQRVFNDSVIKLVDALSERADASTAARVQSDRLVRELEERLARLERRGPAGLAPAPATVAIQPAAASVPDYFAFESRMRGSVESIRERQRRYLEELGQNAPVLDIGCGRGEPLRLATAKLRPGGVLIAETINPLSPIALRNYFADLTHAQPLVPETLELLARQSGFAETEVRFLNEPAERLTEPDDPVIAANVRRLNDLLFAPLDYALVARTAAHA